MKQERFKPRPENTEAKARLVSALGQIPEAGMLSHAALHEIAGPGLDLVGKHKHILANARKIAEKERGVVLVAMPGVGVKRLEEPRVELVAVDKAAFIRRGCRRHATRILQVVARRPNNMTDTDTKRAIAGASHLGAIGQIAGRATASAIRRATAKTGTPVSPIPRKDILRMFRGQDD